ncbi:hypothetical protein CWD63_00210 [Raoultella ornithinolytica]|nr:ead/Ea22-like family protein [Raoultella ornithinolytica]PQH29107.1 hypothetical protein CWD63_00210 [Raoultella ornithinolytica]
MTTDITELAQREKFEAWFKSSFHPDKTGPYIKDQLYFAWKAAGAELVEALEKARREEPCEHSMFWDASGVRRCSKCDIPEHANVHYADAAEMEIAALRQRIAELESRTVTVKLPDYRNTYKSPLADEVEHQVRLALELFSSAAGIKVEAE